MGCSLLISCRLLMKNINRKLKFVRTIKTMMKLRIFTKTLIVKIWHWT